MDVCSTRVGTIREEHEGGGDGGWKREAGSGIWEGSFICRAVGVSCTSPALPGFVGPAHRIVIWESFGSTDTTNYELRATDYELPTTTTNYELSPRPLRLALFEECGDALFEIGAGEHAGDGSGAVGDVFHGVSGETAI